MKKERGIHELYGDDPERADALVFGRVTETSRRGFLGGAGLAAVSAAVGGVIPFAANMPAGLIPAALAQAQPGGAPSGGATPPKEPQPLNFPARMKA
jgi:sulfite oxidase